MKPELKTLHKLSEIRPVIRRYQILVHSMTAYLHVKCSDNNKNNQWAFCIADRHSSMQQPDRHKLLIVIGLCRVRLVLVQKVDTQQCLSSSSPSSSSCSCSSCSCSSCSSSYYYYYYYYLIWQIIYKRAVEIWFRTSKNTHRRNILIKVDHTIGICVLYRIKKNIAGSLTSHMNQNSQSALRRGP